MARAKKADVIIHDPLFSRNHIYHWVLILGLVVVPLIHWTIIEDMFTGVKWITVYAFTAAALAASLLSGNDLHVPKLGWVAWGLIAGAMGLTVLHPKLANPFGIAVGDRLHFICLVFLFFNFFKWSRSVRLVTDVFVWVSGIVALWGIVDLIKLLETNGFLGMRHFSTFGNVNMTAEYLGLGFFFQLYAYQNWKTKSVRLYLEPIIILTLVYLFYSLCRSVGLSIAVGALYFFIGRMAIPWQRLLGLAVAAGVLIGIIWFNLPTAQSKPGVSIVENKKESSNIRSEMWRETLEMIQDHPLGVGPGRFEYEYTPYQMGGNVWPTETEIYKSPHNEYLRFAVEDGVLYVIAITILLLLLFWRIFRWYRSEPVHWKSERYLLAGLFTFFAVESFFQFPLQNPFPFFFFAALIGWAFRRIGVPEIRFHRLEYRWAATTAALALVATIGGRFAWTSYSESHYPEDLAKMTTACEYFPENWRYCLRKSFVKINQGNFVEAKAEIKRLLYENPFNFPALRFWGVIAARENKPAEVCQVLFVYDSIFGGKSNFHSQFSQSCMNGAWFGVQTDLPQWDYYRTRLMNRVIATQGQ